MVKPLFSPIAKIGTPEKHRKMIHFITEVEKENMIPAKLKVFPRQGLGLIHIYIPNTQAQCYAHRVINTWFWRIRAWFIVIVPDSQFYTRTNEGAITVWERIYIYLKNLKTKRNDADGRQLEMNHFPDWNYYFSCFWDYRQVALPAFAPWGLTSVQMW